MSLTEINEKFEVLLSSWEEFKTLNDKRLSEIERRNHTSYSGEEHFAKLNKYMDLQQKKIEDLELSLIRPESVKHQEKSSIEDKAFSDYVKYGKSLNNNEYIIKNNAELFYEGKTTYMKLSGMLQEKSPLRSLIPSYTAAKPMEVLMKSSPTTVAWNYSDIDKTHSSTIKQQKVMPTTMYSQTNISQEMLEEDNMEDIGAWLLMEVADAFGTIESQAFFNGKGSDGVPEGIIPNIGKQQQQTFAHGGAISFDDIIALSCSLDEKYLSDAVFLTNNNTVQALRQLKNQSNHLYIWNPPSSITGGETLLGFPLYRYSQIPDNTIIFGNLKQSHTIIDFSNIKMTRDPFSSKPFICFYAYKSIAFFQRDPKALSLLSEAAEAAA